MMAEIKLTTNEIVKLSYDSEAISDVEKKDIADIRNACKLLWLRYGKKEVNYLAKDIYCFRNITGLVTLVLNAVLSICLLDSFSDEVTFLCESETYFGLLNFQFVCSYARLNEAIPYVYIYLVSTSIQICFIFVAILMSLKGRSESTRSKPLNQKITPLINVTSGNSTLVKNLNENLFILNFSKSSEGLNTATKRIIQESRKLFDEAQVHVRNSFINDDVELQKFYKIYFEEYYEERIAALIYKNPGLNEADYNNLLGKLTTVNYENEDYGHFVSIHYKMFERKKELCTCSKIKITLTDKLKTSLLEALKEKENITIALGVLEHILKQLDLEQKKKFHEAAKENYIEVWPDINRFCQIFLWLLFHGIVELNDIQQLTFQLSPTHLSEAFEHVFTREDDKNEGKYGRRLEVLETILQQDESWWSRRKEALRDLISTSNDNEFLVDIRSYCIKCEFRDLVDEINSKCS